MLPTLCTRFEAGRPVPVLVWRFPGPLLAISSGSLGGGIGVRHWALNMTVPMSYSRDDPADHLAEVADGLGLVGPGAGLMTGVDVRERVMSSDAGVVAAATVGIGAPAWAAAPDGDRGQRAHRPGTINIIVYVPARLSESALVNAVSTVAEAKAQAMGELGHPGTGTATDATCVVCPPDGPVERYGGPRSTWGARLARAVHAAVLTGGDPTLNRLPWSECVSP